jgi:hypothetical protein
MFIQNQKLLQRPFGEELFENLLELITKQKAILIKWMALTINQLFIKTLSSLQQGFLT